MFKLDICDAVIEYLNTSLHTDNVVDILTTEKAEQGWKVATKPEELGKDSVRLRAWPGRSIIYRKGRLSVSDVVIEVIVQSRVNKDSPEEVGTLIIWVEDLLDSLRGSSISQDDDAAVNFSAGWKSTERPEAVDLKDLGRGIFTSRSLITFEVQLP